VNAVVQAAAESRHLLSGNEAVARAVWECGVRVAAAYPGTPSTEILEYVSQYPDLYAEWSVNEKVALEVAIGASMAGSRAFCAMKHVGMNVASDALMTFTVTGANGGLVIAIADDVGMSSSQNEQDSRFWGRFAHVPILEPADSQEAHSMMRAAYEISEQFQTPVILRVTTRICHVKGMVTVGERITKESTTGFEKDPAHWVMVPAAAKRRLPLMYEREEKLRVYTESCELNVVESGGDQRIGFITSGPAYMHVKEVFPEAPVLKLGLSYSLPMEKIRALATEVEHLVVVEETEPMVELELKAAGLEVQGKEFLPRTGELTPDILLPGVKKMLGEPVSEAELNQLAVFPRPPTMCPACPHMGVFFTLSRVRNVTISGDIGCYTLGAGQPWNALDTTISMGASMGVALGLDKGRNEQDAKKHMVAVIGDSTFLHMGMQGLLDSVYNNGDVTILLLDNRAVGMTGGHDHPGTGRDIKGNEAPRVDFARLCEALGVKRERIREVDPYELPTLFKVLREETKIPEPSVIITDRPCVPIDHYKPVPPLRVIEDKCTGCGNCLDVGCPAIMVTHKDQETKPSGKVVDLSFVRIETAACTGCDMCVKTCAPDAIVPTISVQST